MEEVQNKITGEKKQSVQYGYVENGTHNYYHYVPFSETDAGGIVYHGRYFDIAERARGALMLLLPSFDIDIDAGRLTNNELMATYGFIIHSVSSRYLKPIKVNETICIKSNILELKSASMILTQDFFVGDELRTQLQLKIVILDSKMQPHKMPDYWTQKFKQLIKGE